jgi:hypothetical protein
MMGRALRYIQVAKELIYCIDSELDWTKIDVVERKGLSAIKRQGSHTISILVDEEVFEDRREKPIQTILDECQYGPQGIIEVQHMVTVRGIVRIMNIFDRRIRKTVQGYDGSDFSDATQSP